MATSRLIELTTPFGEGVLKAQRVTGSETLGRLFEYEIYALSENDSLDHDKILGRHVTLSLELPGGERRHIDACAAQFGLVGTTDNLFRYRLLARSWTWLLTRTSDCRIFQEQTVPDIIKAVFSDHAGVTPEFKLTETYKPRNYCVQYNETDWNFVSRLMEEEGIYTFFRHEPGVHTLVLTDCITPHPSLGTVPYRPHNVATRTAEEHVHEWRITREIQPGAMATSDYDFENPSADLRVLHKDEFEHAHGKHEVFHYPGEYTVRADGECIARTRLQELQEQHEHIEASGHVRSIACGGLLTLDRLPCADQNREYLVVSARFTAINNAWESGGEPDADYDCEFTLQRSDLPYRSPRITPRPLMGGPQTAVVVGPKGEEIFVNEHGQVKCQFFWDRYGKSDDKSSCWIRVSQNWAGQGFGWITLPRMGQEVIVDFLEGNPDNPIIIGRVYNAQRMPPWALPANMTQSGILSRSSKEGSPSNANEFRFEDKKGAEQVYLHAEKNQDIEVENDETHWVGNDRKKTIDHDETTLVKHDRTETVGNNETITIGVNRSEQVGSNETIAIGVNRTETVGANETISIGSNRTESVGSSETVTVALMRTHTIGVNDALTIGAAHEITVGAMQAITVGAAQTITVGANQTTTVGRNQSNSIGGSQSTKVGKDCSLNVGANRSADVAKNDSLNVGDNRSTGVGKDDALKVGKNLVIDAGDSITIKTGSASISMKKDGTIVIKGKDIKIEGSGKINVKASSDIVMKGSKIQQN